MKVSEMNTSIFYSVYLIARFSDFSYTFTKLEPIWSTKSTIKRLPTVKLRSYISTLDAVLLPLNDILFAKLIRIRQR